MQELMEVRLKDEIIHMNNDWMDSNVSIELDFRTLDEFQIMFFFLCFRFQQEQTSASLADEYQSHMSRAHHLEQQGSSSPLQASIGYQQIQHNSYRNKSSNFLTSQASL